MQRWYFAVLAVVLLSTKSELLCVKDVGISLDTRKPRYDQGAWTDEYPCARDMYYRLSIHPNKSSRRHARECSGSYKNRKPLLYILGIAGLHMLL